MRKKRRRRKRVYMRRRMYRRRRPRVGTRRSKIEVKYYGYKWEDQAVYANKLNAASYTLLGNTHFYRDILASMTQGVATNQRIGAKVYVKSILIKLNLDLCPSDVNNPTVAQELNYAQLRVMLTNVRTPLNADTADFWASSWKNCFNALPDRRIYGIHYDKIFTMNSGWAGELYNSATTGAPVMKVRAGTGGTLRRNISIPINRSVLIYGTGNTAYCKNDSDVYSLEMLANMPNLPDPAAGTNTTFRTFCGNIEMRIYYTDD